MLNSITFLNDSPIEIWINTNEKFSAKFSNENVIEISNDNIVYLLRLLELNYSIVFNGIEKLKTELNINKETLNFPFYDLVKTALNSDRDYWVELSIPWITNIGKKIFEDDINNLLKNKKISQSIRHKFLHL